MIDNLKKNEINLIAGGKRCAIKSVYTYSKELAKTLGVIYCLTNTDANFLIKTDRFANRYASNTLSKTAVKRMLCSAVVLGVTEITDYFGGDWFECD